MKPFISAFLFLYLAFPIILFAQQGNNPVLVTDLLRIKSIPQVTLSADGKKAAYTVVTIVPDEKVADEYVYKSQIWLANTDGSGVTRQVTFGKEGASQPAWSPDGSMLAFVRTVDGKPQIFLLDLSGGEPRQLTRFRFGASGPVWSPDGQSVVFTASIPLKEFVQDSMLNPLRKVPAYALEKPGLGNVFLRQQSAASNPDGTIEEVRAYLAKNEADKKAKVITKLQFQEEASTSGEWNINSIFITGISTESKVKLITPPLYSFRNPRFVGQTSQLVAEGLMDSVTMPDRVLESALYLFQSDGTGLTQIRGEKDRAFSNAVASPSGKWLAYLTGKTAFNYIPVLELMSLQGKGGPILIPYDRNKQFLTWSDDEKYLYFTSPNSGAVVLHRVDLASRVVTSLTGMEEGIGSFDIKAGKLFMVKTSVTSPFELFAADALAKNPRPVTSLNSEWIRERKLSIPEKKSFVNAAGQEIQYWVMKPAQFKPGQKYPLLLEIHGGPTAMWGPGESSMWHEFQYFCSKGYGVVYCNPRGSGGYGESFMRSNINDWGAGPSSDVLTALDRAVAEGWADTSRLAVTGGSYAGYLIAWILGHDKRFKAACTQRGVYDLRTFFGEANAWRLVPNYFGGYPWEKASYDVLERESPINYVHQVSTPVIIFHGENDLRTGVSSSEQFYKSLKVQGKPVEYVRHPGATHEITRSGNNRQRIDQMLRTWEFFERFIGK
jgi:dipeptidyl aminopeptidase/acylaminoacyl peptidase